MEVDIDEILVDRNDIKGMVSLLGSRISKDYHYNKSDLIVIGVLKGGLIFLADLIREITVPMYIDMIAVSSYGDDTGSSGIVRIIKDVDINITGRDVLIVEDLIDTGLTLKYIKELFNTRKPGSLKVCAAFDKPSRRKVQINIEYTGRIIPDKFVVGYGLDYAGKYRNLPDLCSLKPEIYGYNNSF